jgi:hypothetical protein
MQTMTNKFGQEFTDFLCKVSGGEAGISTKFVNHPPNMGIGPFCRGLAWQFNNCSWNGGYGGKKWGVIADCLARFVTGETTAEMMLDTIWTLQHNGGCLFNKMSFYTNESHNLKRILDVQRSGQVPEAILFDNAIKHYAPLELLKLTGELRKQFPEAIGHYVDWFKVEALGAVHQYPAEKQEQKKNAMTPEEKEKLFQQELAAKKAKLEAEHAAAQKAAKEKAEHAKNWFKVTPNLEVKKIVREAA